MRLGFGVGIGFRTTATGGGVSAFNGYTGQVTSGTMPTGWAVSRSSSGWYFDSAGTLQSASSNVGRITYNRDTLALQGLYLEPATTNGIRNNTMAGAVSGSPGTLPTNWAVAGAAGLTRTIVGTGTVGGMEYIDIRLAGTSTGTSSGIWSDATNGVAASDGQVWNASRYIAIVGGSTANINLIESAINWYNGSASIITGSSTSISPDGTLRRLDSSATLAGATTAFVRGGVTMTYASGAVVDITLRIALPQLTLSSAASSVIRTTGSAVTRALETLTITLSGLVEGRTYPATITYFDDTNLVTTFTASGGTVSLVGTQLKPIKKVEIAAPGSTQFNSALNSGALALLLDD